MLQTPSKTTQTLLSSRIPRDNEHERYHPELEEELKECLFCLQRNAMIDRKSTRLNSSHSRRSRMPSSA